LYWKTPDATDIQIVPTEALIPDRAGS
jgi:hypothetical protein